MKYFDMQRKRSLSREERPPAECHDSLFQMKHDCKHRRVCVCVCFREVPMCKLLTSFTSETRSSQSHLLRPSKHTHTHTQMKGTEAKDHCTVYYRYEFMHRLKTPSTWAREAQEWDCVLGLFHSTNTVQLVQHARNILPFKTMGNYDYHFIKKLILLFRQDALNCSKVIRKKNKREK